jgi:TPR repeat protein
MSTQAKKDPIQFGTFLNESERHEANGDFQKAFVALLAGAQQGDSSCQINLGNAYADGRGVRKSLSEAARWYKRAYRQGDRCGANNLAIDLQKQGNLRSAIFWFRKAIELHDGDACVLLAKIYLKRRGGKAKAVELLSRTKTMRTDDISEAGREEADALLNELSREI